MIEVSDSSRRRQLSDSHQDRCRTVRIARFFLGLLLEVASGRLLRAVNGGTRSSDLPKLSGEVPPPPPPPPVEIVRRDRSAGGSSVGRGGESAPGIHRIHTAAGVRVETRGHFSAVERE